MKKVIFALLFALSLSSCAKDVSKLDIENTPAPEPTITATPTVTPTTTPTVAPSTPKPTPVYQSSSSSGALDNTGSGWGFVKKKGQKPDIPKKTQELFAKYDAYYMDPSEEKVLYLTFDEGYENGFTAPILDTLKECNVPAAFFITGSYFDRETELVTRMVNEGHIVGNHTENHPNLHKLADPAKMLKEFSELDDKFYQKYGIHMKYMRPPEGEYSERVLATAQSAGYKTMFWSFAYKDWERDNIRGSQYAFDAVTPYLHSGCIILLHAVSQDNANALEDIINYAKEHGYTFKSLDELP